MADDDLTIHAHPDLSETSMILGLSGWMDGGDVSTGTVEYLIDKFDAQELAEIRPGNFYIYNFPGPMELSALFRPHARIADGLVEEFIEPTNTFYYNETHNLILFRGKEPNMKWGEYADCVMRVATEFNVRRICFVGSVSSLVPHTRQPRFHSSVTDEEFRTVAESHGLNPTNYEGPASMVTYLVTRSRDLGIQMATIVAEIPAYVQGKNFKCIESVTKKLAGLFDLPDIFNDLRGMSEDFEKGLNEAINKKKELSEHIKKLEQVYDSDSDEFVAEDLKDWFDRQNLELN